MSRSRVFLVLAVAALLFVVVSATGADKKLSDLTALVQSQWATGDLFAIVDVSASSTKKTTVADFDERYFNEGSILEVAYGGTGQALPAAGNFLYSNGTNYSLIGAACSADQVLKNNGSSGWICSTPATGSVTSVSLAAPSFLSVSGSPVTSSGTLTLSLSGTAIPVSSGGTGIVSGTSGGVLAFTAGDTIASSGALAANQLVIGGGAGVVPSSLSAGTQYQPLVMGASNPGYAALSLNQAAAVTGTLPVGNGGTGQSSLTANNVILGNGTSAVGFVAPGTTGNVLTSNGTTWVSSAASGAGGGTSEWYIDAVMDGGNPDLGVSAVSSYTEIVSASWTLTPDSGSAAVGVMCSSANAATSPSTSPTTCAAGNESMGINFDITTPGTGVYEVCVYFAHVMVLDAEDGIRDYFQLIETPTDAQTHTTLGRTKQGSGHQNAASGGTDESATLSVSNCSLFRWASTGVKGIRLKYQQTVNNAPDSNIIYGDASSSHGDRNIRWTVQKYGRY